METYGFLRFIADSWALVALTAVFIGVVAFAYRPGSKRLHDDAANTIFRNEQKPAAEPARGKTGA